MLRTGACFWQRQKPERYILGLQDQTGRAPVYSRRKTAFVSFLACIKNVKGLFESYVAWEGRQPLSAFWSALRTSKVCLNSTWPPKTHLWNSYSHKISQDHLNLFFCVIRASERGSNNPMAQQFSAAYKQLLMHHKPASSWTVLAYWSPPSRRHWTRVSDSSPNHTHQEAWPDCWESWRYRGSVWASESVTNHHIVQQVQVCCDTIRH